MGQHLIDTNIVSKYMSGLLPEEGERLISAVLDDRSQLSVITQIELLSWKSSFDAQIRGFVDDSLIFPLTDEVVNACVNLRRQRKIRTPDAIIAATAIVNGLILLTDNETDFVGIPNLVLVNPNNL
ncbi:type II toxin-antitoxin system VapC family toxin [Dyadobacter sp. MSC1_007]|jgi:predicted nucleic acid-binding protein|uniref:type II toxin-antitoxin system VapC family toxin n=1 Tax=Dyadobacter sp. MSC1_007 TaxID=2909264 RepID=UPI00202E7284|nr:type II toxin-antitoxin system VapC family toxin [Dyadobacter sp. MSC1_007]